MEQQRSIKTVIVDLDGTLSDMTHRIKLLDEVKDAENEDYTVTDAAWDRFYAACGNDAPITRIIELVQALHKQFYTVVIMSGRREDTRLATVEWLASYRVPYHEMYLRVKGDKRADVKVKADMLNQFYKDYPFHKIDLVLEDRDRMVEMWRSKGFTTLQVANGRF